MTFKIESSKQPSDIYQYAGKLLLQSELPADANPQLFTQIPSITRKLLSFTCMRCGNQKHSLFGKIPCANCNETHLYCRNCIQMGRVMECEALYYYSGEEPTWTNYPSPMTWQGELTPAQQQASSKLVQAIQDGMKAYLVWAVCGSGKTEMLFEAIEKGLQLGKRICIATPRADVVRELKPRIQSAFQEVPIQALYGGSDEKEGSTQLIIATTHQLLRYHKTFDIIIIDEIDAFPYHNDPTLSFAVNRAKKSTSTTVYLTATPRQDLRLRIARKHLPHTFVPIRYHGHPLPVPQLVISYSLKKTLKKNKLPKSLMKWMNHRENPKRQMLIFVPTIQLAENLSTMLKEMKNLPFQLIDSVHSDDEERIEKINQFRYREIDLLITTTILERGVTFPSVDVMVLDAGHTVFDEAALVQIAGRAGRSADDPSGEVIFLHEGKTDAMVQAVQSIKQMNKRGGF
ncbi:DEAD/DEAH box helicase family protein [Ornithinibacillus sp. BX22]|uniref:DEAD/DEAH box helicase family protein n=2 Tax=Ornithinibacillus hominis TaxID=2763055 RepID=A0A923L7H0_9BACI|nr:DEAD/DEAH box helicase family protein [Ornithinibacillus hominis]